MTTTSRPDATTGFATSGDTRLFWEQRGSGEPILLIHAGIADSRMWDPQMDAFSANHHVIRYDTRGMGRSTFGAEPYSDRGDAIAILDALKIERAHLIGISYGGSVALDAALDYPHRVTSLVLGAAFPRGLVSQDELVPAWEEIDALLAAGKIDEANEREIELWVDGPHRTATCVDPALRELVRDMNRASLALEDAPDEIALDPPAVERLDQITQPVLVIAADFDQPSRVAGPKLLAERLPNAEFVMLSGAAHMLNLEQPAAFNTAVLDFLRCHPAPPTQGSSPSQPS